VGYNFVADIMDLSSFVLPLLPPQIAKSGEIPTKLDLTAIQGHPRSSILVSIESPYVTSYYVINYSHISNRFWDIHA